MTDKVQKIREEVEKLHGNSYYMMAVKDVLAILDTMQREPISEDLEIAANEWDAKASFTPFYMALDDNGSPYEVRQDYTTHAESFKAGAKWQKEQMMKEIKSRLVDAATNQDNSTAVTEQTYYNGMVDALGRLRDKFMEG